jgi:hypothetical protein
MPDTYSVATGSDNSPTDPVIMRHDELGRVVQTIGPKGQPPTIVFYGSGHAREVPEESPPLPHPPVPK